MKEGDWTLYALHRNVVDQLNSCASEAQQLCINVIDLEAEVMKPFAFRSKKVRDATCTIRWRYELNL